MQKISIAILLGFISPVLSVAQIGTLVKDTFETGEFRHLINSAFNKFVSSNPSPGEIANYASLDPANASFVLKGSLPIQPGRKKALRGLSVDQKLENDPARISYLTFSM